MCVMWSTGQRCKLWGGLPETNGTEQRTGFAPIFETKQGQQIGSTGRRITSVVTNGLSFNERNGSFHVRQGVRSTIPETSSFVAFLLHHLLLFHSIICCFFTPSFVAFSLHRLLLFYSIICCFFTQSFVVFLL